MPVPSVAGMIDWAVAEGEAIASTVEKRVSNQAKRIGGEDRHLQKAEKHGSPLRDFLFFIVNSKV
ncbi:MAG: hypothetical protein Fur006_38170 [Coleofasciculaceae cyanobacterium]